MADAQQYPTKYPEPDMLKQLKQGFFNASTMPFQMLFGNTWNKGVGNLNQQEQEALRNSQLAVLNPKKESDAAKINEINNKYDYLYNYSASPYNPSYSSAYNGTGATFDPNSSTGLRNTYYGFGSVPTFDTVKGSFSSGSSSPTGGMAKLANSMESGDTGGGDYTGGWDDGGGGYFDDNSNKSVDDRLNDMVNDYQHQNDNTPWQVDTPGFNWGDNSNRNNGGDSGDSGNRSNDFNTPNYPTDPKTGKVSTDPADYRNYYDGDLSAGNNAYYTSGGNYMNQLLNDARNLADKSTAGINNFMDNTGQYMNNNSYLMSQMPWYNQTAQNALNATPTYNNMAQNYLNQTGQFTDMAKDYLNQTGTYNNLAQQYLSQNPDYLNQANNFMGQLQGGYDQNQDVLSKMLNTIDTGNIPSGLTDALNDSVNRNLQSNMGSMLNDLSNRGVLNSSITSKGVNNLAGQAANAYNDNFMNAWNGVVNGYANALNGGNSNINSMLGGVNAAYGGSNALNSAANTALSGMSGLGNLSGNALAGSNALNTSANTALSGVNAMNNTANTAYGGIGSMATGMNADNSAMNTLFSGIENYGKIPQTAYTNAYAPLMPAYNFWKSAQASYDNRNDFDTVVPVSSGGGSGK